MKYVCNKCGKIVDDPLIYFDNHEAHYNVMIYAFCNKECMKIYVQGWTKTKFKNLIEG